MLLQQQIDEEVSRGLIRNLRAEHLLVNILGLCVFPYLARPIIQNVFNMKDEEYQAYLESRQTEIIDFVLKSIAV